MNLKKLFYNLEIIEILGILTVGFLQVCSLTFGKSIISIVLWPTILLAGVILVYRLINFKKFLSNKNLWLLVAFCMSFLLTIVLNIKYGWYENIRTLIWLVFLMFILYCYRDDEDYKMQYRVGVGYYLFGTLILNLIAFYTMFTGIWNCVLPEVSRTAPIYYIGFVWGRLYGAYWDANIGATMCVLSVLLSCGYVVNSKKFISKFLFSVNALISFAYIVFSDSRTGMIGLLVGSTVFAFIYLIKKHKVVPVILVSVLCGLLAFGSIQGCKNVFNYCQENNITNIQIHRPQLNKASKSTVKKSTQKKKKATNNKLKRDDEFGSDISNRRFDIWNSAIEIFKTSPVYGIGHNNVVAYAQENLPDTYIITNSHQIFDSMHSTFFDILVGQGIIGLVIYFIMGLTFFIEIVKNKDRLILQSNEYIGAISIIFALFMASCVMTEIVYVTSPTAAVFWLSLGKCMKEEKNE